VKDRQPIRVWRVPIALAAVTAFGLLFALFVDGAADAAAWVALATPVAVVSWFASPRVQRRRAQRAANSHRPPLDGPEKDPHL
jgi:hypothetical protein